MDQGLHVALHGLTLGGHDLEIIDDHGTQNLAQPIDALLDDAIGLSHLFHAHEVTIIAITFHTARDVEVEAIIHFVRLLLAVVPLFALAANLGSGYSLLHCALGRDHADADGALLPDAVVGE